MKLLVILSMVATTILCVDISGPHEYKKPVKLSRVDRNGIGPLLEELPHEVIYKPPCEDRVQQTIACYEETMTLQCTTRARPYIKIVGAVYGRDPSQAFHCPSDYTMPPACTYDPTLTAAKTYVQGICGHMQSTCTINVQTPDPFPDACANGARNYLKVQWYCCSERGFSGCQKRVTKRIKPWVTSNCQSAFPLYTAFCHGGCPSTERLNFPAETWYRNCQCCRATEITEHHLKVYCLGSDGTTIVGHIHIWNKQDIDRCGCQSCP